MLRIKYLRRARTDIEWFRHFYQTSFPEGEDKARSQLLKAIRLLMQYPEMGKPEQPSPRRSFLIPDTAFRLHYRNQRGTFEIVRLIDTRSEDDGRSGSVELP